MANRFYLIENGKIVLESAPGIGGAPVEIDVIGTGDLLGWSWIFPPHTWHFTARAVEPTTSIFFYGTILREYCEKDPALGYALFKRMSEVIMRRLQRARDHLIEAMEKTAQRNSKPPCVSHVCKKLLDDRARCLRVRGAPGSLARLGSAFFSRNSAMM